MSELRGGPSTSFGVFATLSLYLYDDHPFIVLTETKFSFRCIPVWIGTLHTHTHTVCCVLIARTQGADLIQRGGIALRTATAAAAKAAAGALWQPGGRAGPGTLPT